MNGWERVGREREGEPTADVRARERGRRPDVGQRGASVAPPPLTTPLYIGDVGVYS